MAASAPSAIHDATPASSGVGTCDLNTSSMCNNSTPSPTGLTGGLAGFALTTGYDQATGIGSLEINNFLTVASALSHSTLAATTLAITGSASSISDTQMASFTATLTSKTAGIPGGSVQFYADDAAIGVPVVVSAGKALSPALPFTSAGSYLITAMYSGDATFAATTAPGITLNVTGLSATTRITAGTASFTAGGSTTFTATVTGASAVPTGLVRFYTASSGYIAVAPLVNGSATSAAVTFATAGNYAVTAYYLGDGVYSPANGSTSVVVTAPVPAYQLAVTPTTLALSAGATTGNTATVNLGETNGFVGTVNLTCTVTYNGSGTPTYPPACSLASSAVAVNAAAASTTLTVTTTLPHAVQRTVSSMQGRGIGRRGVMGSGAVLACVVLWLVPVRRRRLGRGLALVVTTIALSVGIGGCGGGGTASGTPIPAPIGTSTGSYTLTITASSSVAGSTAPAPVTIALTVM